MLNGFAPLQAAAKAGLCRRHHKAAHHRPRRSHLRFGVQYCTPIESPTEMILRLTAAAICLLLSVSPVPAASVTSDRHWSTNHLAQLPAELRSRVLLLQKACGSEISAQHYFSTSIEFGQESFRALHFQDLSCQNRQIICAANGCLHEIYRRSAGIFRRVFSLFAQDIQMETNSGSLLIRAALGGETRIFRWRGRSFVRAY